VAIPALIAYLFFVGRVDRLIIEIDALGQQVVNAIAADAWTKDAAEKPSKEPADKPANSKRREKAA
jgi:biopolymer transport protein ExbB